MEGLIMTCPKNEADDVCQEVYKNAEREVDDFAQRLCDSGMCPRCVGLTLLFRGLNLAAQTLGSDDTSSMLAAIANALRTHGVPPPQQSRTH
jgi:hypothetical protein